MNDILLYLGVTPYCVVRNCAPDDYQYIFDNYGFCLSKIVVFDSIYDLEDSDFVEVLDNG